MDAFERAIQAVNRVFIAVSGALVVAILGIVLYDVFMRNVFDAPTIWALDVSRFILLYVFFLALGPALQAGSHVSVDVLDHYLAPLARRRLRLVALTLVVVFGGFLLWQVGRGAVEAFVDNPLFPTLFPIRVKYVHWIGPVGVAQFLLTALVLLARTYAEPGDARTAGRGSV